MLYNICNFLITYIFIIIQTSPFLKKLSIFDASPDFVILIVLFLGIERGAFVAVIYGFFTGLILDSYSLDHLGINALSLSTVGFLCGRIGERIYKGRIPIQIGLAFLMVIINDLIWFMLSKIKEPNLIISFFITQTLPSAIYTSLLCPVIFFIIILILRMELPVEKRWKYWRK